MVLVLGFMVSVLAVGFSLSSASLDQSEDK